MNTPAHLIFGLAAFGKPGAPRVTSAAMAGAFAPDLTLYAMVSVSIWVMGIPPDRVFRELYYSDAWQAVFAVDNSFIIWGILFAFALWSARAGLKAFASAGLLHLTFDFPLHTHDARQHFWPVTDWVFYSPFSYWDSRAHANIIGPIELTLSLGLALYIWTRFKSWRVRVLTSVLVAAQLMTSGIWRLVF